MSQVKPKIGGKYLVRDNYITGGGEEFMADMERWKKTPLTVDAYWEDEQWIWAGGTGSWLVRIEDLIPYKTARLENK